MMAELWDDFKSPWDHFLGSIIPFVKVAIGTGSVWKANTQAHLLRSILFNVYLKCWRGAQNGATPSVFSQVHCACRLENYVLVCAVLTEEAAKVVWLVRPELTEVLCSPGTPVKEQGQALGIFLLANYLSLLCVHITNMALTTLRFWYLASSVRNVSNPHILHLHKPWYRPAPKRFRGGYKYPPVSLIFNWTHKCWPLLK